MLRINTSSAVLSDNEESQMADAKALAADRKIYRLLGPLTYAGFAAGIRAFDALPDDVRKPETTGLFTMSRWEPLPELDPERGDTHYDAYMYLQENSNVSDWLKNMSSETLCQLAIARDLRGPNCHHVGSADSLNDVLTLIECALMTGEATVAVLLGFEPNSENTHPLAQKSTSRAVAITFTLAHDGDPGEVISPSADLAGEACVEELALWAEIASKSAEGVLIEIGVPAQVSRGTN